MTTVYFVSGLGADKRAFKKIKLPEHFSIKHIDWITPIANEALRSYAERLTHQIDTNKPFLLVGLSFGGIIAIEIAKIFKPIKTIIISSASTRKQIPWYYKLLGKVRMHYLLPAGILKSPNKLTYWFFGAKSLEEKELLKQILLETDTHFLKWAISKIMNWDHQNRIENLFHIHGTADKILPIKFMRPDISINDGGHLMVFSKADELSEILTSKLTESQEI